MSKRLYYNAAFVPWNLFTTTGTEIDDIDAAFWQQARLIGGSTLVAALLLAGVGLSIGRPISGGVKALDGSLRRLSDGDFEHALPRIQRRDELGAMARSVASLRDRLRDAEVLRGQQARLGGGNGGGAESRDGSGG